MANERGFMKQGRATSWIWDTLSIVLVLCACFCLATIACSLEDDANRGTILLDCRQQSLLTDDDFLREQQCDRRESSGNEIPNQHVCILVSVCGFGAAPSRRLFDFIPPAQAGLLFFLRHIPVRAGPCRNC